MSKEQRNLTLKVVSLIGETVNKYFTNKSEHDHTIERMHATEMATKKECLDKIILFETPLVAAGAFYLKEKVSQNK